MLRFDLLCQLRGCFVTLDLFGLHHDLNEIGLWHLKLWEQTVSENA